MILIEFPKPMNSTHIELLCNGFPPVWNFMSVHLPICQFLFQIVFNASPRCTIHQAWGTRQYVQFTFQAFNFIYFFLCEYLNLISSCTAKPPRNHVFHLRFPREWRQYEVVELFKPFGMQVPWSWPYVLTMCICKFIFWNCLQGLCLYHLLMTDQHLSRCIEEIKPKLYWKQWQEMTFTKSHHSLPIRSSLRGTKWLKSHCLYETKS